MHEPCAPTAGLPAAAGCGRRARSCQGRLSQIGDQAADRRVGLVAEQSAASLPFPGGGFAFHPGDHSVDDGVPLEQGERAKRPVLMTLNVDRSLRAAPRCHDHVGAGTPAASSCRRSAWFVVTCRDMTEAEKKTFRRKAR